MSTGIETLEFQAEARQLLQLMVHSIYSNKDIFLRELISNASDALDKLRLEALVNKDLDVDASDLHVALEVNKKDRILTVRDNGIGMSRDEVVALIGTIAKSGTAELLQKMREVKDAAASQDFIGQFGVGFYSSFMVADQVTLVTRRAGSDEGTRWESHGEGTYTVEPIEGVPHGTTVTLHLKPEDAEDHLFDYTSEWKIREIVKRYSDFIAWPIRLTPPEDSSEASPEGSGDAEGSADAEGSEAEEGATATRREPETLNSMKALWARSRDEVDEAEYKEFYKHISHDWNDPLDIITMKAEGTFEYLALLFIPSHAPLDLFTRDVRHGVQLYVKRVFIMDDCKALIPSYLRFVKGVVDAADLSLNVSREILQQDRQIQLMRRRLVKKVLSTLKTMMTSDAERYGTFWREFGKAVKEGLLSDFENQKAILDIASFASTRDAERLVSLKEYVERMPEGQDAIYYMTGETRSTVEHSPHMEAFSAKGYEVLILTDPVDDMWVESVTEFDGKRLQSIAKGQVDLDSDADKKETEPEREKLREDFAPLLSWMAKALAEEVKDVRLSSRLTTSPACLVGESEDVTPTLEKIYRAMGQELPHVKRILELNPAHPLVLGLRKAHGERGGEDADLADLAEIVELLHGMALLAEGGELGDPSRFARVLAERLTSTL